MTKPSNIEAIENITSIPWPEWIKRLETKGGADLAHSELAAVAQKEISETIDNPGWWAQSIAVAYEQHIGRRQPGQQPDGTFQVAVSKTIHSPMDEAMIRWLALIKDTTEFRGIPLILPANTSEAVKSRHWGCNLQDGTRINADAYPESPVTTIFTLTHIRLPDAEAAETWRTYWKTIVKELQ